MLSFCSRYPLTIITIIHSVSVSVQIAPPTTLWAPVQTRPMSTQYHLVSTSIRDVSGTSTPSLAPPLWSWHAQDSIRQVTNQFIWWYPWLTSDIKSYPVFRWTVEVPSRRGVTSLRPTAARQPGAEMNETYGMSTVTSEGITQDNSA